MTWQNYISSDPRICHGQVCVKGTRIPISVVLDNIAEGLTAEEIVKSYPSLTVEAIRACVLYASSVLKKKKITGFPSSRE